METENSGVPQGREWEAWLECAMGGAEIRDAGMDEFDVFSRPSVVEVPVSQDVRGMVAAVYDDGRDGDQEGDTQAPSFATFA